MRVVEDAGAELAARVVPQAARGVHGRAEHDGARHVAEHADGELDHAHRHRLVVLVGTADDEQHGADLSTGVHEHDGREDGDEDVDLRARHPALPAHRVPLGRGQLLERSIVQIVQLPQIGCRTSVDTRTIIIQECIVVELHASHAAGLAGREIRVRILSTDGAEGGVLAVTRHAAGQGAVGSRAQVPVTLLWATHEHQRHHAGTINGGCGCSPSGHLSCGRYKLQYDNSRRYYTESHHQDTTESRHKIGIVCRESELLLQIFG